MTKVKICGLTNLEDAKKAEDLGADFLGFIFFEKSPRVISPDTAKDITSNLHGTSEKVKFTMDIILKFTNVPQAHSSAIAKSQTMRSSLYYSN